MVDGQVMHDPGVDPRVITVVSPKGGVGRTMIAANLASVIARSTPTVLVDGDVHCGDVEFALGLRPVYRLDDLVAQTTTNPDLDVTPMLARHGEHLSVLCAPKNPLIADQMESRTTWAVIRGLIDMSPCAVLDTGPGLGPLTVSGLDVATWIVLVCGTDTASVNAARTMLGVMDQLGLARENVRLVVNRPAPKVGLHLDDVEKILGVHPSVVVPEDGAVATSMNKGVPVVDIAAHSAAAKSIVSLASSIQRDRPVDMSVTPGGGT